MRSYIKKLAELAAAGFVAGASSYVVQNGVELSSASLRGLLVAAALSAYGLVVRKLGEDNTPSAVK